MSINKWILGILFWHMGRERDFEANSSSKPLHLGYHPATGKISLACKMLTAIEAVGEVGFNNMLGCSDILLMLLQDFSHHMGCGTERGYSQCLLGYFVGWTKTSLRQFTLLCPFPSPCKFRTKCCCQQKLLELLELSAQRALRWFLLGKCASKDFVFELLPLVGFQRLMSK